MSISDVPGLAEKVEIAVRPLTEHGDFYLEKITHDEMHGDIDVLLTSKEFNIQFHVLLKVSGSFRCLFHVNSVKKSFSADTLFRACQINIPLKIDYLAPPIDYQKIWKKFRDQKKVNEFLLEESKFIEEMNRLCKEINENLPIFDDLFISSNIDKTWDLYIAESRKKRL
jgi:hypothetical protein